MSNAKTPGAPADAGRRAVLTAGVALAGAALTPQLLWAAVRSGAAAGLGTRAERALLESLCELVIPRTDTPSAAQVGVPEFILLAVAHGSGRVEPGAVSRVDAELSRRAGRPFLSLAHRQRHAALEELDAEAYSPRGRRLPLDAPASPSLAAGRELADWRTLKLLILTGYYCSEAGATRELRYEFVPGRYEADVPFVSGSRALMNDWWGNSF